MYGKYPKPPNYTKNAGKYAPAQQRLGSDTEKNNLQRKETDTHEDPIFKRRACQSRFFNIFCPLCGTLLSRRTSLVSGWFLLFFIHQAHNGYELEKYSASRPAYWAIILMPIYGRNSFWKSKEASASPNPFCRLGSSPIEMIAETTNYKNT